jgi:hypothetical protein
MPNCVLTTDFEPSDCVSLGTGGTSGAVYLIDYDAYLEATVTEDATTKEISAIALTTLGSKAIKYDLTRGAPIVSSPLTVNNAGKSGYTHTVQFFVPVKTQALKTELTGYVNFKRAVLIVVIDSVTTPAEVFGNDVGMSVTAFDELTNDPAQGGGFNVTFSTPADVTLENLPARNFFITDRATTLAALETLRTAVV